MSEEGMVPFEYERATVRSLVLEGEPWFVAKDVCDVLGIANVSMALRKISGIDKGVTSADTPGGTQQLSVVSEAGLYRLILRSATYIFPIVTLDAQS